MYTKEKESRLKDVLNSGSVENFIAELNLGAKDYEILAEKVNEEWRKLSIAFKNGLMDEEQVKFALIAFFGRESTEFLQDATSDS